MGILDAYRIDLGGMRQDTASYHWQAGDEFFAAVGGAEIQRGRLDVSLLVTRHVDRFDLTFRLSGAVTLPCDRCLEPMEQPIAAERVRCARLGAESADDGEELTVPEGDGWLNVAWTLYELAALEIPLRHVHPEGGCDPAMARRLEALQAAPDAADGAPGDGAGREELRNELDNNKQ